MNKIMISVGKEYMTFSKYNRDISEENLNNTNVIDVKSLKFTEEYINENIELVSTFINLVILKFDISRVIIKNIDIAETVLVLLKYLNKIKFVKFTEDKTLTYTISSLLLENKNLDKIECYNLPDIMFYRFDKYQIETRCKILSTSNFLKLNNINTYSDIFNKEKIIIEDIEKNDLQAIFYFFDTNKNLKKLYLKKYNRKNLEGFIYLINKNNLRGVTIIIFENDETTNDILKDINLFDNLSKKNNINIRIKYSKEYKEKNRIKELNIRMLKNTLLALIIIGIILFIACTLLQKVQNNKIKDNISEINNIVNKIDEQTKEEINNNNDIINNDLESIDISGSEQYVSSYYTKYDKIHEELLKLNNDTIGWLTINNTKIDYPVVQTSDNEYYLNHAFDKVKNQAGWIFVDYRNNLNNIDQNTIIYGHSLSNSDLMFTTLINTIKESWYNNKENLTIDFSIKGKNMKWQIFSIYTIEETNDYLYVNFNDSNNYINFVNKMKDRSIKSFETEVNADDKILTLSTCYKNGEERIVVHAKLLK